MFLKNKYTSLYYKIIAASRNREKTGYTECHHIVPRSLGGSDAEDNLVKLSAREHYLVHLLLTKMTVGVDRRSMAYALSFFNTQCKNTRREKPNSRWYEYSRRLLSEVKRGTPPSQQCQLAAARSRRGVPISAEQKAKIREALCKKIAFSAIAPNNTLHSGPDLHEFCGQHGLSFHTIVKRLGPEAKVITAGKCRGWIYSSNLLVIEDADQLRAAALLAAHNRRSAAIAGQWDSERREAVGQKCRQAVRLRDPYGNVHHFTSLALVKKFGPVSTIQLSSIGQRFKSGAWAGWTRIALDE